MRKFLVISGVIIVCLLLGYHTLKKEMNNKVYNINTEQFIKEHPEVIIKKIENKEEGIYYFGFHHVLGVLKYYPF